MMWGMVLADSSPMESVAASNLVTACNRGGRAPVFTGIQTNRGQFTCCRPGTVGAVRCGLSLNVALKAKGETPTNSNIRGNLESMDAALPHSDDPPGNPRLDPAVTRHGL